MNLYSDTFWCEACDEERPSDALFCQKCGTKVTVRAHEPEPEPRPAPQEKLSRESKSESLNWFGFRRNSLPKLGFKSPSKKQLVVASSLVAALVIAGGTYGVVSSIQQQREEQLAAEAAGAAAAAAAEAAAEKRRLEAETLVEAFGQDQVSIFLPSCEQIAGLVSADEEKWAATVSVFDGVSDPREASRVLATVRAENGTLEDADVQAYTDGFEAGVADGLVSLFDSSSRDEKAPASQIERWESAWRDFTREACPEEFELFDATYSSLTASAAKFSRMSTLASQVPWYPEGFREYSSTIAYQWVKNAGNNCYSCRYSTIDVVSKRSCSRVYAEVNFEDASGRVVDWTNDSLPFLEAFQVGRLQFETYSKASGLRTSLNEINCG